MTRFTTLPARAREERGAILILTALVMIILLLIAALATDLGAWYRQGQEQQRAADVASLNGVQAHDASLKAYYDANGVTGYSSLTDPQKADAEDQAFQDAVNSVLGALAAGGMNITDVPVITTAIPPAESTATVTAVDGTSIVITRTATNAITVNVGRQGDQYFSNFVRDAPEITREGSAVISNCNADCSRDIELIPPFPAFDAIGKGDGWGPILHENEVWALNHHLSAPSQGNIVCMNRDTESFCDHGDVSPGLYSFGTLQTANRSQPEYIKDGKIFFPSRDSALGQIGLACFDMEARAFCANRFEGLLSSGNAAWPNTIQIVGPWEWNGNLYMLAQDGQLGCVNPDTMTACGIWDTDGVGYGHGLFSSVTYGWGGLDGDRLYLVTMPDNQHVYHCWNLATQSSCWGGVQTWNHGHNRHTGAGYAWNFLHRDTGGNVNGICTIRSNGNGSFCVNSAGSSTWVPTAMESFFRPRSSSWMGAAHDFTLFNGDIRTFFTGGTGNGVAGNNTLCWDWSTANNCGAANHQTLSGANLAPYGLARASETCLVGLGHTSRFFTIDVNTMETCDDTVVSTDVYPCTCGDGSERYGVLELPEEMKSVLASANATVTGGGTTITGDLLNGPFDLAPFNGTPGPLTLTIEVNSIVNADGSIAWKEPYTATLALITQPTLTGD